jgi:ABC-type transporter Mla subunit MlaD
MLTRFVRIQLAIFTIVGIVGVVVMVLWYIQAPTLLGIGKMTVTLKLPATGGLYRFSNVTYRGVQIWKVTAVGLTPHGAEATSLNTRRRSRRTCKRRCAAFPRWANIT